MRNDEKQRSSRFHRGERLLLSSTVPYGDTMLLSGSFFGGGPGRGSLFRRSGCFCSLCEQRSSAEADPFAGRKVNGCPTTDGFDGPCRDRGQLPRSKAHEAHLVPPGDFFADGVRQGIQHGISLFQIHMGPGCDQMGEFLFANDFGSLGLCCGHRFVDPFDVCCREWRRAGLPLCCCHRERCTVHWTIPASFFSLPSCPLGQF